MIVYARFLSFRTGQPQRATVVLFHDLTTITNLYILDGNCLSGSRDKLTKKNQGVISVMREKITHENLFC